MNEPTLPELPIHIDRERMERALAGPRYRLPAGLSDEQMCEFLNTIAQAIADERERCAKLCDAAGTGDTYDSSQWIHEHCATAIRKG